MLPYQQKTADLVIFTEEIRNGKHFLCSVRIFPYTEGEYKVLFEIVFLIRISV